MRPSLVLLLSSAACHPDDVTDAPGPPGDTDVASDSATPPVEVPEDNVARALGTCLGHQRTPPAYPNQLGRGTELERYTLRHPQAVCNDGTPAVLYVRPATDPALEDVWSLHLQGGGVCSGWASCALRWCGLQYYDASKMSSAELPDTIDGFGIYDGDDVNVLAGANQVFFYYCSSDAWGGQGSVTYAAPAPGDTDLPVDVPEGLPSYTMFTRGHVIVEAAIAELERGVVGDLGTALPSLREAARVVLSGTSGGSAGAARHADWLAERLAPNGTEVRAIFDAANTPAPERFEEPARSAMLARADAAWQSKLATSDVPPFVDASCALRLGGTDEAWRCDQQGHLVSNHVTTPFLLRQDLTDLTDGAEEEGVSEDAWEVAVRAMLLGLADLATTAAEGDAIEIVPGAYGPNCGQHVALESTRWWVTSRVTGAGDEEVSFQQAVVAWSQGRPVRVVDDVVTGPGHGPRSTCVASDDAH